jgi:Spy/CpxP family protein refolding chaperone
MMFIRSFTVMATLILAGGSTIALTDRSAIADSNQPLNLQIAQRKPRSAQANWLRELNLSPEQVQQIQDIRNQYQERLTTQQQAVRQAQQELKQLMASNASTEQIRQKFDQLQSLKQRLGATRMESMLAIRNVLNPEQRQKLNEVVRQRGRRGRDQMEGL